MPHDGLHRDRLALTLPLGIAETPTSFASRLARLNGLDRTSHFCSDIGVRWRELKSGDASAVRRLADYSAASVAKLRSFATSVTKPGEFHIGRHEFRRRDLERTRFRACLKCLEEDRKKGGEHAPYLRAYWSLRFLNVCHRHRTAFAVTSPKPGFEHDWRYDHFLEEHQTYDLAQIRVVHEHNQQSIERYLVARLQGRKKGIWLDSSPISVVARTSEAIGSALLSNGESIKPKGGNEAAAIAANFGFEALIDGQEGFERSLIALSVRRNHPPESVVASLGCLVPWLAGISGNERYGDIAEVFQHYMRSHSLQILTVPKYAVEEKSSLVSRGEAARLLGANPDLFRKLLATDWFPIKPYAPGVRSAYAVSEIEGFLARLDRKKQSPTRFEKSVRLGGAGSSRRFDVVKILKAILEGRIKYGFGEHYHGIRAINFDVSDLRKYEDRQTKSIERAAASKRLMVSLRTIDWLCERRLLKTGCTFSESILANPPIAPASLEDFEARFVSLHSLAKSLGLDTTSVLRHANKHGVWAELSATGMTPIFRRSTAWLPSEERLAVGQHFGPQEKSCGEQCKFCGEAETQP